MKRLRIALLRGAYLGPFEAQSFEPLLESFDVRAYVLPQNRFDLDGCRLPVRVCRFPDAPFFGGRSLCNAWRTRVLGERYPMPGVDAVVRGADVVHTFEGWYAYTRQAARACRRRGVPLVITHWDTKPYAGAVSERDRASIAAAYDAAARVLAPTETARRALVANGVAEGKILLQPMGVDAGRFSPGPRDPELCARLGIGAGDFVHLFVGRLAEDKGVRALVGAFEQVRASDGERRRRLVLVGSGPEEAWIRRRAADAGLGDEVVVAPPVPYGEVHRWHRLADLFVFPSVPLAGVEEQFGYALVEAMSTGRAIVAARSGGIPDVLGDAGVLVPAGDAGALAAAMRRLERGPDERRRLGEAARRRVLDAYSSAVVAEGLARTYRELCKS